MRKLFIILSVLILIASNLLAQNKANVQWADTVLGFSSERKLSNHYAQLHPTAYKATMALGKPNIMPGNEGTARVWTPKNSEEKEFIKLGFHNPIIVRQIAIAEVFNLSAISNVWLYTTSGKEVHLDFFKPKKQPIPGRLFLVFIDPTEEPINAIKIEIDNAKIPGYTGIDAVAISDSYQPIDIFAKVADGVHTALDPEKMDENINSPYKEIKPLLSPDGNMMYFSRINHPENTGGEEDVEDIWFAIRNPETGEWNKAQNAGEPLNNEGPNFIASISPSGYTYQLLLGNIYLKNGKMADGLSLATKTESGFSEPEKVEIEEYENLDEFANFYLAPDGKTILMSVQRRDTYGARDIYVSFLQQNGKWSIPLNLGKQINTGEVESTPYLAADGKTLFYSSKGHLGYGGLDVFISKRLDDSWTKWSEPENLGTAINSKDDDMFFYLSESDTKYAYFTRGIGHDADIYRLLLPIFQLPDPVVILEGKVLNSKTGEIVTDARISFREKEGKRVIVHRQFSDKVTGGYKALLPFGKIYELYANQEGYITLESQEVDLSSIYDPDTIYQDIYLDPIEVGQRIPLDKIYFNLDDASLRDESIPQLDLIYEFMVENPSIGIEVDGHTCNLGSEDYNQRLSEKRARSVRGYLISKGIKSGRIKSAGYGEQKPISTNETEEGRQTNRRVEFIITDN